ncbi:MAG: helix-turn-helix domain-containing protein [Chloroflexota bacterium]|jgi:DNA-binding HxlR family transcriptional regulator|nr:helix-turn-helix transcriptional regulator [Chloroflexota bacterium]
MSNQRNVCACPVENATQLISGKWKARILWKLHHRTMRYGELRRELIGITEKMLAQQLREMENDGLIVRTQYPEMPPKVEYSLSKFGKSFSPILEQIALWGQQYQTEIVRAIEKSPFTS